MLKEGGIMNFIRNWLIKRLGGYTFEDIKNLERNIYRSFKGPILDPKGILDRPSNPQEEPTIRDCRLKREELE